MDKLRIGVVGAGKMGMLHAGIFNTLERSKVVAFAEKDRLVSSALEKYLRDIHVYRDFEKMFSKEMLDVVVITTPVFLHKEMVEKAIDYDLNIFVEKPLAKNSMESRELLLDDSSKNKTLVGYCRRFMGTYQFVKKVLEEKLLGDLIYFQSQLFVSQCFGNGKGWQYNPEESGGGVLMDLGCHAIDLFHYYFGNIGSVHGLAKFYFNENVEDFTSINIKFKNDLKGSLQVSWSVRNYGLPELKVVLYFEHGEIVVTEKYVEIYSEVKTDYFDKGISTLYKQELSGNVEIDLGGPEYTKEDAHLLNCIDNDCETICNFKEAAKTNFVLEDIYSSIAQKKIIKVNYGDFV